MEKIKSIELGCTPTKEMNGMSCVVKKNDKEIGKISFNVDEETEKMNLKIEGEELIEFGMKNPGIFSNKEIFNVNVKK